MKNLIKLMSVALLVVAFGCNESDGRFQDNPQSGWVQFNSTTVTYFNEDLVANGTSSITVPVQLTAPINPSDLTVTYNIVDIVGNSSDVVSTTGSIVFPANTNTALNPLTLNIDLDQLEIDIFSDYVFDVVLTGTNSSQVKVGVSGDSAFPTSFRVNFSAPCMPPTIGGTYSVYTEYGFHDFLPNFATHTMNMNVVDNGDGTYFVQDFSGGLYTVGPYVAAYGTGPNSFDVTFFTVCDDIDWTGQNDPWGSVVPNGVNEVDSDTGVLTISWLCNGYGENGVSVYTPL
jgi:hypothetical protein